MSTDSNSGKEKEKIFPSFTELRIYPSFTEIREKFNAPQNFKMYFPREVYDQIVNGSLNVEGIEVNSQNSVTKANNLENQTVFIRHSREEPIECLVIRPNDLLLKDVKTGRYIRGQHHELEYVNIPEEEGQEVTFALKKAGEATLSYLIHGITWSPRYNLKVESDGHHFEAWADMTNNTKRDYKIKHTELFGGDVNLQQSGNSSNRYADRCCCIQECCLCSAPPGATPTVQSEGELAGLYWYSIDQPFVLIQQSTFSLPFVKPTIKLEKYAGLQNYFQERTQKGKFQRKYRIESDKFLPKGTVTIREDGRVVGQAHLSDITQGEKQDLDCGNDPDVSFIRDVKVLSQKRDSATYLIRLTIKNSKTRPIKYEYKEIISSAKFTVNPKNDDQELNNKIQLISEGFQILDQELQSNNEQTFQYEVLLEYRNNQEVYPTSYQNDCN
ncbi:unnamed protein product [Rotaria socialis]|uniref:DUF4139 domain-containing protein n=1 Tax=Rotaria socialis TaxID=392032 RepID=A0A820FH38_9BILA|nr:unnamed protein product [Rotaria socialis]CAF3363922.1 unnamed protein product [Rotaria socialis]CAF3439698.1 unnamed protein product [Rotaria socialis]CAF3472801.1 unnamed protein product [Rotaria socialis]CAF3702448.1 unnamed protein product [Rotaria socialis]